MLKCILSATIAIILCGATTPAWSQVIWQDGQPVFQSDIRSNQRPYRAAPVKRRFKQFPKLLSGGSQPIITPSEPAVVAFPNEETNGTIIIDTQARKLYLTLSRKDAYQYPISVGREGFTWKGTEQVSRIADWPDWHPPKEMREREPGLPEKMTGGLRNPLGAKAIYLGKSLYRIHGTNDPRTIGRAASSGCFRMLNRHVIHLAEMVEVGTTTVKVVDRWPSKGKVARTKVKRQRPG